MRKEIEIVLSPEQASETNSFKRKIASSLKIDEKEISHLKIIKKSTDARKKNIVFRLKFEVFINEIIEERNQDNFYKYKNVKNSREIAIIGSGPAGLFAALELIENGLKPIIFERGKDVKSRKIDIALLHREKKINSNSNYCFGEGGAGTFSDGKLYTRSTKRGDVGKILKTLVNHGANDEILFEAHPHIGSDKLPTIITEIREMIISCGGEIHFNNQIIDILIENNSIKGFENQRNEKFNFSNVIFATGHSARDIYELFHKKGIEMEAKPFAVGVRVEHPQQLIDNIQYHSNKKNPYLPTATYSLVNQINGRGIFSFCMCPGGVIVPAGSDSNQIVVNGMSNSLRNSPYANSGIVVTLNLDDYKKYGINNPLSGLLFQSEIEKPAFDISENALLAPAQKMTDFVNGKTSTSLNPSSYLPGLKSFPLNKILPKEINECLQKGFLEFDKKMKGFYTEQANVIGFESRTSSPIRIVRNNETFEHVKIAGLYPCGEGAGYAGGIVSSAIDGINSAKAIAIKILNKK